VKRKNDDNMNKRGVRDSSDMEPKRDLSSLIDQITELFLSSPLPFFILHSDGSVISCNRAFSKMFGLYPDEARGLDLAEKVSDFTRFDKFLSELESGKPGELECGVKINDKTRRLLIMGWKIACDPKPVYAILVEDAEVLRTKRELKLLRYELVTTKKKLESAQSRYKSVVGRSSDVIFVLDSRTTIREASPAAERMLGYKSDELIDRQFDFILSPKDYPEFEAAIENLKREPQSDVSIEVKLCTKQGVDINFSLNIALTSGKADHEPCFIAVAKDITEPKFFDVASYEPQRLYYDLFEQADEGIILLSQNGTILNCNRKITEMFDFPKAELVGKPISVLLVNDQLSLLYKGLEALKRGEPFGRSIEFTSYRKDGKNVPVEICISGVFGSNDELEMVQCFVRDISWRKQLEQQLTQTQKMDSLGMMAGGIAHDFNNLLGGILGYATYAQTIVEKDHAAQKAVATIIEAAKRASDLTSQLLTFAKNGKLEQEQVNINKLVREAADLFKRSVTVPIKVSLDIERDLYSVVASSSQVQQVLLNILFNARDAMPSGGEIKIVTRSCPAPIAHNETMRLKEDVDCVKVSISDTGVGIPQDMINRIFEPFFTTKSKHEASGFGLSIVYSIMERHGGYVSVESEVGKGSTFNLYFPVERAKMVEQPVSIASPEKGDHLILVVDDEQMMADLISDILKSAGYRVLASTSASEAVELFKDNKEHVDLVIADFVMPKMTGRELLDRLREIKPNLKAIVSSGYAPDSGKFSAADINHEVFISKPFEVEQLLKVVQETLKD